MRHIYVHVPFCARRCSYCDFAIAVRRTIPAERFVSAIVAELDLRRTQGEWDEEPTETLYFGGGTPSLLPAEHLAELVARLVQAGSGPGPGPVPTPGIEVTIEANPDDVTEDAARAWRRAGISRVSLGSQSFDESVLRWMHRTHQAAAVPGAVYALRAAGFDNISLDLIFGLPEELERDFERDLERAVELAPLHLSVYGLSVEPRTPLARWITRGATSTPSEDRYAREFLLADRTLTHAGFEHYEISNYARPGSRSRHNCGYWSGVSFAGLGPAAHSLSREERRWNLEAWSAYQRSLAERRDPTADRERLTPEQRGLERLYLSLRTSDGLPRAEWRPVSPESESAWIDRGWLLPAGDERCRLSPEGWLRLDEIITLLTTSSDSG